MKKILIPIILSVLVAVSSCGPKRYLTTSRAPGVALDRINIGAYNNDPGADKARTAFDKADKGIAELNRLRTYDLEEDELAILMGATVTTAELNRISGVTSAVQTQINGRLRSVDSTGNAAGNYVTRKALADTVTNKSARIVRDTIADYLADATIGVAAADSNIYNGGYVTRTYVESLLGSGEGMATQRLPFIIGTTAGAPANADTIVTHTAFSGKHIDLYRDGAKQYQNYTATNTIDGFRVSGSDVVVNPAWATGEQVIIDITEPVFWSSLAFEGEESTLLTGLSGYWKLDETSGTTVTDATGTQDGTRAAGVEVGIAGKLSYANTFDAASDVINIPYNTDISPKDTAFSIAAWIRLDSLPNVVGHECYVFQQNVGVSPWSAHWIHVDDSDNRITAVSRNTAGTAHYVRSTDALLVDTWYHIVFVNPGDGGDLVLYVNGVDVSASVDTFSGTILEGLSNTCFGNAYGGAGTYFEGTIDSPAIWSKPLISAEVTELYNSGNGRTHPFN